ncbi:iron-containing alcohol dehydrogenase [Klebsiella huaxiensis]|uniref:Iron-containing alcohol dehydrogenase n=1 Tax=Klebsiella huaxiensis TaxID=2153354 RepID=A0ABT6E6J5_9ENTR|nr:MULTISPECIES: iron-containing alcohol dehydrogenase [Klebsiella]MBA7931649.1 iron-containing alcohol dehydrogenase [Klebsiella sp. RHBSTW-00215]MDG1641023.1 iron-containing alcohol dehydrogenase [Klebsiella huaxiensis]QBG10349.1 iron-containing alcohol dehydrogenase [Klebsiella huaxiensis]VUT23341.1 Aldehyde-alcohol dehydrogenase [Klebsiella huaxiensis]
MTQAFSIPRSIIYGEDALEHLSTLSGKKAALVTGGSSMKRFGFLDKAIGELNKAGMECIVIDNVEPNPSIKTVWRGAKEMLAFEPDWIVAIGGGSALDAAKVMWCFYEHPELKFEDIIPVGSMPPLRNKARFVAIPSTSGSASEITAFSVITDTANHIKYPIVAADLVPDIAILDPTIPAKMPPHVTAHTGMDVMTHALEAYVSTAANSFTDPYAVEAIRLVFEHLETAYRSPDDLNARMHMHNASALAGIAFTNASLGLVHSMAHKIGGEFGITHGLANAIMLPYIIQYNAKFTKKYRQLEEALGINNLIEALNELNKRLGIPKTLSQCDEVEINEVTFVNVLDRMSGNAVDDPCTLTNPNYPSVQDVKGLYTKAFYGA